MICPECGIGKLKVTNTYRATEQASTRSKVCLHCGQRFTEVLRLTPANKRGEGAAAVARQLQKERADQPESADPQAPSHGANSS